MFNIKNFSLDWAGKALTVEIGHLAGQAHGSCRVRYGETEVLATVVLGKTARDGVDYFPLLVDYEERLYAAGKIKGSRWIKREGRATDEAVLTARVIDRSIRPLFKETERKDVQVMVTVLSVDGVNDPDVVSLFAASLALMISPLPWNGPIAAVRLGRINGEWVINGTYEAREKSDFDLIVAGTKNDVVMIEAGCNEMPEAVMAEAIVFAQKQLVKPIQFIEEIQKEVGVGKIISAEVEDEAAKQLVTSKVKNFLAGKIDNIFVPSKVEHHNLVDELRSQLDELLKADNEVSKEVRALGLTIFDQELEVAARDLVLNKKIRVDGRKIDQIREITCEVSPLVRTHGSALFTRGETQVLSVVTLGAPGDEQYLDGMEEEGKKRYMHHYNFPGFATGEVKPSRGPGRREIGHGALAEKALLPVLPKKEDFPYTIRVVSEVLSSNGSSSQASICGSSLSLMDAGVPISNPVAGIAMGLITNPNDKNQYEILTDIQGLEDHSGDMDFKVGGTTTGITAIQLDIKLGGISLAVVKETLDRARTARLSILDKMKAAIAAPRAELSQYAPRILTIQIDPDKIRDVIGSGGKIINKIIEETGSQIDIEQSGLVFITATSAEGGEKALEWIKQLTHEVTPGEEYEGPVTQIIKDRNSGEEIGAVVELLPGRDGMIHISNLAWERVGRVTDILNVGDTVKVKVIDVDKEKNRISLSRKVLLPKPEGFQEDDHRSFGPRRPMGGPRPSGPRSGGFGARPPRREF
ncbi:MAG: polyribonucleotide nucleotidyltransferase [Candidatus Komeilibacteria bacterium]|nr:polyribonucleotide nucleotidyltransferase [Candidatus Komeilibacteria bacterium]